MNTSSTRRQVTVVGDLEPLTASKLKWLRLVRRKHGTIHLVLTDYDRSKNLAELLLPLVIWDYERYFAGAEDNALQMLGDV